MFEFDVMASCPRCDQRNYVTAAFDDGMDPVLCEHQCFECDKTFYFKARFEIEVEDTYLKKPAKKRRVSASAVGHGDGK